MKFETIEDLKRIAPNGEADERNFFLFSTSGCHGTYTTIEEAVNDGSFEVTVTLIQPRIINIESTHIGFEKEDVDFLLKLRESSWKIVSEIGRQSNCR